jgi:DNA-binding XRE family transcriptional regulator
MAEWSEVKKRLMKDQDAVAELEKNEFEYKVISEIIRARIEKNITQNQLAAMIGTKQSNISRLESGEYNPSLEFLNKVAQALGKSLDIKLV